MLWLISIELSPLSESEHQLPRRRRKRKRRRRKNKPTSTDRSVWYRTLNFFGRIRLTIAERAKERSLGWLLFVLLLTTSLALDAVFRSGFVPGLFNGLTFINFVIHELGHLACKFAPAWIHVAAGTVFQMALPIGAVFMFVKQRDDAASCFALCWVAISLMHTADYMADARAMAGDMTLSAGFWSLTSGQAVQPDELGHDWNFMLDSLGLLKWDTFLAGCTRVLAGALAMTGVAANGYMAWSAWQHSRSRR